ncbi:MAG: biotin--[acetyl-CoA-carboxylase] ligase [Clostridia bacterium]
MNIEKIKKANTNKIGKQIEYYKEIESTHTYAKKVVDNIKNDGKIIIAEVQTAGIGTRGRKWYTGAERNIAMTIILHPKSKVKELDGLTTKIAQCIQNAINELYGYKLEIKEPNDLLLKGKKICGILTEVHTRGEKIEYLLISFGFNVNEEEFPEETKEIATSLKKEYKREFLREDIIVKVIEKIEKIEI